MCAFVIFVRCHSCLPRRRRRFSPSVIFVLFASLDGERRGENVPSSFFRPRTDLQTGDRPSQTPPFLFSLFPFLRIRHEDKSGVSPAPPPSLVCMGRSSPAHLSRFFFLPVHRLLKYHRRSQGVVAIQGGGASLSRVWGVFNDVPGAKKKVECVPEPNREGGEGCCK